MIDVAKERAASRERQRRKGEQERREHGKAVRLDPQTTFVRDPAEDAWCRVKPPPAAPVKPHNGPDESRRRSGQARRLAAALKRENGR